VESIIFLIIFLVFRAVVSSLLETRKTQAPPISKTAGQPNEHQLPSRREVKPKTIPIKEIKADKTKRDISSIPLAQENLQKENELSIAQQYELQHETQLHDESVDIFSELFSEENILRGIVLQEILSPPKALMQRNR